MSVGEKDHATRVSRENGKPLLGGGTNVGTRR